MADPVLLSVRKLAVRDSPVGEQENGVVAEAAGSPRFICDLSVQISFRHELPAVRKQHGDVAGEMRAARFSRETLHLIEDGCPFDRIGGACAHETGGMDAGASMKRVDEQAGVVGHNDRVRLRADGAHLDERILTERFSVLLDVRIEARFLHRQDLKPEVFEDLLDLLHLARIPGRENDPLDHALSPFGGFAPSNE